jgi:hypothetical protein
MTQCPKLAKCIFFNDRMSNMPGMAAIYKQGYCLDDFEKCARFIVASKLGPDKVPSTLYPNDSATAHKIIAGNI